MALLLVVMRSKAKNVRQSALEEMRRLYRPDAPPAVRAQLSNASGRVHAIEGRYADARREFAEGAALLASAGRVSWELVLRRCVGEMALLMGDVEVAVADLRETANRLAAINCKGIYPALTLGTLATANLCKPDAVAARAALSEAAPAIVLYNLGFRFAATAALLAASEGRYFDAAQLLGYGEAAAATHEIEVEPVEAMARERALQLLAVKAMRDDIEAAKKSGAGLSTEAAYRLALAAS